MLTPIHVLCDCYTKIFCGLNVFQSLLMQRTVSVLRPTPGVHRIKQGLDLRLPGRVAQSVTCLATDACLTAIPGVASSIPARSHTFVEIDHEIISTVILLPSADSFKKGCCQLQAKVCARITGYPLVKACPGKSVVR